MLLDEAAPRWHHRERHAVRAAAPPADLLAAAAALTWGEVPLFRLLMAVRSLGTAALRVDRPILADMTGIGFAELARDGHEVVYGAVGRPWSPSGGLVPVADAASFRAVDEPGWARMAMNFAVADGWLTTETRVWLTDSGARRRFAPYWAAVRPFSGAIRRAWLTAIARRAVTPV
jgi:hypothetical protein